MKPIPFNLNDNVKVKLTVKGLDILREEHEYLSRHVPSLGEFVPPSIDSDGYSSFQLWDSRL